ncbi:MAG: YcaO-like family protein [Gemmatimonadaceae bacterium]
MAAPEDTLVRAKAMALQMGISRVTDITRLDRIGIPVFASIRPGAMEGSLCVNAGKGVRGIEAEVGAYMEAIECAVAEPVRSRRQIFAAMPRDLLGGGQSLAVIANFCPFHGQRPSLALPIDCVVAEDLVSRTEVLVPAELVFLPYEPQHGPPLFGSSSNGLSSGNSISEATLHALLEIVERDVVSFQHVRDRARAINLDTIPKIAKEQIEAIHDAGLAVHVRAMREDFGIPVFVTDIFDPGSLGPVILSTGYGCHVLREIALIRAITEAVQCRLSAIHGGRDDLERAKHRFIRGGLRDSERRMASSFQSLAASPAIMTFTDVKANMPPPKSIDDAVGNLIDRLLESGIRHVCRVVFTSLNEQLQVVRLLVPGLEHFSPDFPRLGPRLLSYLHDQVA